MADKHANAFVGKYVLTRLNGKEGEKNQWDAPTLQFESEGDKLRVFANVANSMNGLLSYENGKLTGMLMSTRKMGPPFLMDVERALFQGFEGGMHVTREGGALKLSHGNDTLEFTVDESALLRR
ncbi:protein of unknown function DUF306 [Trypanosoma melophagium]|uniref:protein of unknown function DUF306 n=1 Tax=Trypanosoma melophagium TaxID=715481 RepID=UPI00351A0672|nr:protein of unknown function DUF306 [Trypanosoma melophagium]KAH9599314.1 protein of unknown function DUF306 [Trypanosoma melophagium]